MGSGFQIAQQVADSLLQKRVQRELDEQRESMKVGKGKVPEQRPGQFGQTPRDESAYQAQRAGERLDYSGQGLGPEGYSDWLNMTPEMGAALSGSKTFTADEVRRGYRRLPGLPRSRRKGGR